MAPCPLDDGGAGGDDFIRGGHQVPTRLAQHYRRPTDIAPRPGGHHAARLALRTSITDEVGGSGGFTVELAAKLLEGEELSSDGISGLLKYTIPDEDDIPIWEIPERESVGELPDEWLDAIQNSEMDSRHDHLNALLEG